MCVCDVHLPSLWGWWRPWQLTGAAPTLNPWDARSASCSEHAEPVEVCEHNVSNTGGGSRSGFHSLLILTLIRHLGGLGLTFLSPAHYVGHLWEQSETKHLDLCVITRTTPAFICRPPGECSLNPESYIWVYFAHYHSWRKYLALWQLNATEPFFIFFIKPLGVYHTSHLTQSNKHLLLSYLCAWESPASLQYTTPHHIII